MSTADKLDDPLDDLFGAAPGSAPRRTPPESYAVPETFGYVDPCRRCAGTGVWRGRGRCLACGGTGRGKTRKTSPEARAHGRELADARRERRVQEWREANPAEWAWLESRSQRSSFAASVLQQLLRGGDVTDRQLETVRRLAAQDAERDAERAAEKMAAASTAPAVDASAIESAFAVARARKVARPVLRLGAFKFAPAPAAGRNAGAIYVTCAESKAYLGKVQEGRFQRVRSACTEEQASAIASAISDPHAAAVAYGRRFGQCSVCGRELTRGVSIDRGIGPICAERFGW